MGRPFRTSQRAPLRRSLTAFAAGVLSLAATASPAAAQASRISNTAWLEYVQAGGDPDRAVSNTHEFDVITDFEPGQMSILRLAPGGGLRLQVAPVRYSPSGQAEGSFSPAPAPTENGRAIPLQSPVTLEPAPSLSTTGVLFLRIIDQRRNLDKAAPDHLVLTVTVPETGDSEMLQLQENGPDTGVFTGAFSTAPAPAARRDGRLPIQRGHGLVVMRADMGARNVLAQINGQSKSFGVVISSATGLPLNNIPVTLVDAVTGLPAQVFSDDGVTPYPSTVRSGAVVVDGAGRHHEAESGRFRFPNTAPGTYRVVADAPLGFKGPSATPLSVLLSLRTGWLLFDEDGSWGRPFVHPGGQIASFDVPLDPDGSLRIEKTTNRTDAALGDVVFYGVNVVADGSGAAGVQIIDDPPAGFHYRPRSARLDGEAVAEPTVDADGRLRFFIGNLQPEQAKRLSYGLQVGGRAALGQAINRARAEDAPGRESNVAMAALRVRDDFFGRSASLVGRVVIGACGTDPVGVEGVRVYLEDGAVAVTDKRGRYHFEDVRPGAHVVKLDRESLPEGATAKSCGPRSRERASRFVDVQGGALWRADFRLIPGAAAAAAPAAVVEAAADAPTAPADAASAPVEPGQTALVEFVTPEADHQPRMKSVHVTLRHDRGLKVVLLQGDRPAQAENFEGTQAAQDGGALSTWRGLDLVDGANRFVAVATDVTGREVARVERVVTFTGAATAARLDREGSLLSVGPHGEPEIVLALTDAEGRPARPGSYVEASVEAPHAFPSATDDAAPVRRKMLEVDDGGLLRVRLAPVDRAERVVLGVALPSGEQTFEVELREATRDWLLVALASGTAGQARDDNILNTSLFDDRVAFFAKGRILDDWSLKVGYDSERGRSDERLFTAPEERSVYPLYGDQSRLGHEAPSSGSLYARLENDRLVTEFGDFEAAFFGTELTAYRRRMHGLQGSWTDELNSVQAFVSDTGAQFVRDEIPLDGTSGVFRLRRAPLIVNSERVALEIRDRFRAGEVRSRRSMARHVDYEIDYGSGEIFLTNPVLDIDSGFETVVLTVEYETIGADGMDPSVGLRAERRIGEARVGATFVREPHQGEAGQLFGLHAEKPLNEHTRALAEVAVSDGPIGTGSAVDVEILHEQEHVSARAYLSHQDRAFGLGRRRESLSGVTEFGVEGRADVARLGGDAEVHAQAYHRDSAMVGGARAFMQAGVARNFAGARFDVGARRVSDVAEYDDSEAVSDQLLLGVQRGFMNDRLTLRLAREHGIAGHDDVLEFPTRTLVRADWRLNDTSTAYVTHEQLESGERRGHLNRIGVRGSPWGGAQANVSADQFASTAGARMGLSYGFTQALQVVQDWTVSAGFQRREGLEGEHSAPAASSLRF
ncbi:MAG TPA: hypothetical protein VF699_05200, partial [Caulobacteraceae bacterium]